MKKRVGELEEFEFENLSEGRSLHVTVAVSGWITSQKPGKRNVTGGNTGMDSTCSCYQFLGCAIVYRCCVVAEDYRQAWLALDHSKEQYSLKYESQHMKEIGEAIEAMTSCVAKTTGKTVVQGAIVNGLLLCTNANAAVSVF